MFADLSSTEGRILKLFYIFQLRQSCKCKFEPHQKNLYKVYRNIVVLKADGIWDSLCRTQCLESSLYCEEPNGFYIDFLVKVSNFKGIICPSGNRRTHDFCGVQ